MNQAAWREDVVDWQHGGRMEGRWREVCGGQVAWREDVVDR